MCIAAVASTSQEISAQARGGKPNHFAPVGSSGASKHQPIDDATFIKLNTIDANIVEVLDTTAIRSHAISLRSTELNETSPPPLSRTKDPPSHEDLVYIRGAVRPNSSGEA